MPKPARVSQDLLIEENQRLRNLVEMLYQKLNDKRSMLSDYHFATHAEEQPVDKQVKQLKQALLNRNQDTSELVIEHNHLKSALELEQQKYNQLATEHVQQGNSYQQLQICFNSLNEHQSQLQVENKHLEKHNALLQQDFDLVQKNLRQQDQRLNQLQSNQVKLTQENQILKSEAIQHQQQNHDLQQQLEAKDQENSRLLEQYTQFKQKASQPRVNTSNPSTLDQNANAFFDNTSSIKTPKELDKRLTTLLDSENFKLLNKSMLTLSNKPKKFSKKLMLFFKSQTYQKIIQQLSGYSNRLLILHTQNGKKTQAYQTLGLQEAQVKLSKLWQDLKYPELMDQMLSHTEQQEHDQACEDRKSLDKAVKQETISLSASSEQLLKLAEYFETLLAKHPFHLPCLLNAAFNYTGYANNLKYCQNDEVKALDYYQKSLALFIKAKCYFFGNGQAYLMMAYTYESMDDYVQAMEYYALAKGFKESLDDPKNTPDFIDERLEKLAESLMEQNNSLPTSQLTQAKI